jgi:ribosomal protein S12 methylthiotransferase accessory factor
MRGGPDRASLSHGRTADEDARRGEDPGRALRLLLPRLSVLGITRIGDITGLDRIGIPVVQAVRPLGLANAVTQGKGRDRDAAAVSAIMEAAEQFFAERIDRLRPVRASAEKLGVAHELFARHVLPNAPANWPRIETAWTRATDLLTGGPAWLPLEMVHTAYVEPPVASDGLFFASTTGLAAAFSERAAVLHGLLECLERDAVARAHRVHGFFQRFRIDPGTAGDAELEELVERVRAAGLHCAFWSAPGMAGVPVVWCQVMEDGSLPLITPYPADGFAADPDPVSAARRALLEAAQSRLAAISGARDDITRASFPRHTDWGLIDGHRRLLAEGPKPMDFAALRERAPATEGDPLDRLLRHLSGAGISSVLCTPLDTRPCRGIAAVRVVVPELRPLTEG